MNAPPTHMPPSMRMLPPTRMSPPLRIPSSTETPLPLPPPALSPRAARAFRAVRRVTWFLLFLSLSMAARVCLASPDYDFHPPPSVNDPTAAAIMRDLAERLLPVYQDSDPDRYLANLSSLQMVVGSYSAADVSRQTLRERQPEERRRPMARSVIYDVYAGAKAIEAEKHVSFAEAFTAAFRDAVSHLGDQEAYAVIGWFSTPPEVFRDALQKSFDQLRAKDSIGEPEAVQLVGTYLSYVAYREFGSLIGTLDADEDGRRYAAEPAQTIKTADGAAISVLVIRPKASSKPQTALLEFTLDESQNDAKECAAHGYVGVVAYTRGTREGPGKVIPYQFDGDDARAVINWIAAQPWSDGRVGMVGSGYSGYAAWAAARQPPPALKAIATAAPTAPGIDFPMSGNIFRNAAFGWSYSVTNGISPSSASNDSAQWRALDQKWYSSGSRYRDIGRLYGKSNPLFIRWLNHPSYDRYWQKMIPFKKQFASINIPVLTTTGYYSASEPAALYYFTQHLRYNPHADHTLLIGPYDDRALQHAPPAVLRGYSLDPVAVVDLRELRYQWFDHVFKGSATTSLLKDRVNYEVMGANQWRHAASLETMNKASLRFYLDTEESKEGRALTQRKPTHTHFVEQSVSLTDRGDAGWMPAADLLVKNPGLHNALMFTSEPLTKAAEFNGLISGRLSLTVNKMDVDLDINLYERLPSGDYLRLTGPGNDLRASYARDRTHRRLLKAGEREELAFRSERMTGRLLRTGSRLVMVLGISKRSDREVNYGTGNDVSEESIADGKVPLRIRWFPDSYIDVPLRR